MGTIGKGAETIADDAINLGGGDSNGFAFSVGRSQWGDTAALELLVRRYHRVLYTVAFGMLGDADEAGEATRASLVRTYALFSMHDSGDGFYRSALRLLAHDCLGALKSRHSRSEGAPGAREIGGVAPPLRSLSIDARRRRVHAAILQLLPELRAVVVLRHFAGLSYQETALTLGLSRATVRSRLHGARRQLGERLMPWHPCHTLRPDEDALLQSGIDGELNHLAREARDILVAERADASVRAAALRELAHLVNSIVPEKPPADIVSQVLAQLAVLAGPR